MDKPKSRFKQMQLPGTEAPVTEEAKTRWFTGRDSWQCLGHYSGSVHGSATLECETCGEKQPPRSAIPAEDAAESKEISPLDAARHMVLLGRDSKDGIECPVCLQFCKTYRRAITMKTVRFLVKLYWMFEEPDPPLWVKVGDGGKLRTPGGDYAKLRWWGLVEQQPGKRDDGSKNTGMWCITEFGRQFCRRQARIQRYVWIYDNQVVSGPDGAENPMMNIDELSRNKFSYEEIMSWR